MSTLPNTPYTVKMVSYADDFTLMFTNPSIEVACESLNDYLADLNQWLDDRKLIQSAEKSDTFYNLESGDQSKLRHQIQWQQHSVCNKTRDFWSTPWYNILIFSEYSKQIHIKLVGRNNVLKSPVLYMKNRSGNHCDYLQCNQTTDSEYCSSHMIPQICNTQWSKLQVTQKPLSEYQRPAI